MLPSSLLLHYQAAMLLSGAGDALGYKNGSWEFCHNGKEILKELKSLGGLTKLKVKRNFSLISPEWRMYCEMQSAKSHARLIYM